MTFLPVPLALAVSADNVNTACLSESEPPPGRRRAGPSLRQAPSLTPSRSAPVVTLVLQVALQSRWLTLAGCHWHLHCQCHRHSVWQRPGYYGGSSTPPASHLHWHWHWQVKAHCHWQWHWQPEAHDDHDDYEPEDAAWLVLTTQATQALVRPAAGKPWPDSESRAAGPVPEPEVVATRRSPGRLGVTPSHCQCNTVTVNGKRSKELCNLNFKFGEPP